MRLRLGPVGSPAEQEARRFALGPPTASARGAVLRDVGREGLVVQRDLGVLAGPASLTGQAAVIPIATFISDIEAVERAYPTDTPQEILSRVRAQWYKGVAFDQLIPRANTADIYPNYSPYGGGFNVVPRTLGAVDAGARARLTAHADENAVGDNPSPYVMLPSGQRVDVGHLFLGVDALLHPQTSDPYTSFAVPNIDPASWVADVGIASVWLTRAEAGTPDDRAPRNPHPPSADAYWHMSAPDEDLVGDIDSFGLHAAWSGTGQTLSDALRAYYLGSGGTPAGTSRRYRQFCTANGLTYQVSGTSVTWDGTWCATLIARIDRFNDLYGAGMSGAVYGTIFGPTRRTWPHTPEMLDRFLDWLKPRLEAELRSGP